MNTKAAPGPWKSAGYEVVREGDVLVCNISGWMNPERARATGALISAAPELASALEAALRVINSRTPSMGDELAVLEQGHAALAKARGES